MTLHGSIHLLVDPRVVQNVRDGLRYQYGTGGLLRAYEGVPAQGSRKARIALA